MYPLDDIPKLIDELMELLGPPQSRLAKRLGTYQGTISKWRTGKITPRKDSMDKLEKLYYELHGWDKTTERLFSRMAKLSTQDRNTACEMLDAYLRNKGQ